MTPNKSQGNNLDAGTGQTVPHPTNTDPYITREFMDFLQRSRWKLARSKKGRDSVGNYLSVVDRGL